MCARTNEPPTPFALSGRWDRTAGPVTQGPTPASSGPTSDQGNLRSAGAVRGAVRPIPLHPGNRRTQVIHHEETMRVVIQRAASADVTVDGDVVGELTSPGLLVLAGITHTLSLIHI